MASRREIAASPYWTLTAIFLQPPVSNCLFIYANFWREPRTSGCKITDAGLWCRLAVIFLQPLTSLELKLNRETASEAS